MYTRKLKPSLLLQGCWKNLWDSLDMWQDNTRRVTKCLEAITLNNNYIWNCPVIRQCVNVFNRCIHTNPVFCIENTVTCVFKEDTNTSGFRSALTNAQTKYIIHTNPSWMLSVAVKSNLGFGPFQLMVQISQRCPFKSGACRVHWSHCQVVQGTVLKYFCALGHGMLPCWKHPT